MIDTVIISGGNIQNGFALDFLKKLKKETNRKTSAQKSTSHSKDRRKRKPCPCCGRQWNGMVHEEPGIYSGSCSRGF